MNSIQQNLIFKRPSKYFMCLQICTLLLSVSNALGAPVRPDSYEERDDAYLQFKVALSDPIEGALAEDGQVVHCTLKTEATVDDRVVAPVGSTVIAHVKIPLKDNGARADQRIGRLKLRRALTLHFDRIITPDKQELDISGIPVPQNTIFNNNGTFRQISTGPRGEVLKAKDIDIVDMGEAGVFLPKELIDKKNFFNVNLKEGDEMKVEAYLSPSTNLSGKILKAGKPRTNPQ